MNEQPKNRYKSQITDLITQLVGQSNVLTIHVAMIDATGSIDAALFLSQLLYWSDRGSLSGGWIAKTYEDWYSEIRLSKYEVSKAAKTLADAGVQTKLAKWNGAPTVHYRIDKGMFSKWIVKKLDNPSSRNLTIECEETSQTYTETTPETSTEITPEKKKKPIRKPKSKTEQDKSLPTPESEPEYIPREVIEEFMRTQFKALVESKRA